MAEPMSEGWEHRLIEKLSLESLYEQRRRRRWGNFFKLLAAIYLFALLGFWIWSSEFSTDSTPTGDHTATVKIHGLIASDSDANAATLIEGLQKAFKDSQTKGVILDINSPGGSPVQADLIYREIRRLRQAHPKIPLYAVIADVGASGAYYIAASADKIYLNPASIIGSIGVLMNGFGFTAAMEKLGVERRLLTAGEHKGGLDPFSPLQEGDVTHIKGVLGEIHQTFIAAVKEGRGERLKESPDLFSGRYWSGQKGIELGLADEIGDIHRVAREVIGAESLVDFTPKADLLTRFAERMGASAAAAFQSRAALTLQ